MNKTDVEFDFGRPSPVVARDLLGWELVVTADWRVAAGIIIETEAYDAQDPASHTYRGPTKRNQPMFGPAGHLYIYFTYGMHYCMNIVCGNHDGQAVLLRAIKPTQGIEIMKQRRNKADERQLANGPAKLVQALGINPTLNGKSLATTHMQLIPPKHGINTRLQIKTTPRIGISTATDTLWRFTLQ